MLQVCKITRTKQADLNTYKRFMLLKEILLIAKIKGASKQISH